MISSQCALSKAANQHGSCLDANHVHTIAGYAKGNTIQELKNETQCSDDACLLAKIAMPIEVKARIKREALKAEADSLDGNYWMNNTEIDTCLSQMRKQYPGFAHTFIHMSDMKSFHPSNLSSFDYKVFPLPKVNLAQSLKAALDKRPPLETLTTERNVPLTSIGIVFNTDTSAGSGQHWFAVYISTDHRSPVDPSKPLILIEVFNSSGLDIDSGPFQEFWAQQRVKIAQETGCPCEYRLVSSIAHQRDDTGNCGSYSLFYIYSRLQGANPSEFNVPGKKITDETMQRFRAVLFKPTR